MRLQRRYPPCEKGPENCSFAGSSGLIRAITACFTAVLGVEAAFLWEWRSGPSSSISLVVSVCYIIKGSFLSARIAVFYRKCKGFGIFSSRRPLWGTGTVHRESSMIPVFSPLFDRIAGPQMPASPISALHLPLFFCRSICERRLLLPLIEPRQPPSKGAQKRLLADGFLAR